jgi:beta-galactosidase
MKCKLLLPVIITGILLIGCKERDRHENRLKISMNPEWKFIRDTLADDLYRTDIDDSHWQTVDLPHTARIEPLVVNDMWQGTAWYRKHFTVDKETIGKKVFIRFESAMQVADVWINGNHNITHLGGYLPFIIDISDEITGGDNILAVRLNNEDNPEVPPGKPMKTLDFDLYGGLYRNVEMIITGKAYITDPARGKSIGGGVFVRCDSVSDAKAIVTISTDVQNDDTNPIILEVRNELIAPGGRSVATTSSVPSRLKLGSDTVFIQALEVANPDRWQPDHPALYSVKTTLLQNNTVIDELITTVGIRDAVLRADGFYLNGKKTFVNGTNRHQEYPYIGYALPDEAQYRDAIKIKNAGFDLVRLSHYPQSEAFLDACDELGILVMDCIPGWQFMGDDTFRKNSLDDCRNMIRRDRNHPSIVFWEMSLNETQMDSAYMNEANRILDQEFSDQAISAGWIDYPAYDLFIPARQHAQPPDYWNKYRTGERAVFIAEYGDWEYYAQDAGLNQAEFKNLKPEERTSRQSRGTGEKGLLQQALNFQEAVNSNRKGESTIGQANWLMFDYNRGYADDIETSGISDIFRIPKFSYYFFQSQRPPVQLNIAGIVTGPMVYIASYWQPESSLDLRVFSNCEEVELYLNDQLVERKKPDQDQLADHLTYPPFTFHMKKFIPGTLKAVGYMKNKEVAGYRVQIAGNPKKLELICDFSNEPISTKGKDVIFIYARVLDENGNLCMVNDIPVHFQVEGDAVLIGENPAKSEAGIAAILLQSNRNSGEVEVNAQAEYLTAGEIKVK